jgi:hypothetical protein
MLYQVGCFVGKPFSDEGDDRSSLLVAASLVDAMSLFQTAQIFSLKKRNFYQHWEKSSKARSSSIDGVTA